MNQQNQHWDKGRWQMFTNRVRERYGSLTEQDCSDCFGDMDALAGKIHQRHGGDRGQIRRDLDSF
jgi:uncharacterized protein YjbJ (UPF0337 family)